MLLLPPLPSYSKASAPPAWLPNASPHTPLTVCRSNNVLFAFANAPRLVASLLFDDPRRRFTLQQHAVCVSDDPSFFCAYAEGSSVLLSAVSRVEERLHCCTVSL